MLEVVEHEQQLAIADVVGEHLLRTERLRDRFDYERGIADRRQPDPEDAGTEMGDELCRRL